MVHTSKIKLFHHPQKEFTFSTVILQSYVKNYFENHTQTYMYQTKTFDTTSTKHHMTELHHIFKQELLAAIYKTRPRDHTEAIIDSQLNTIIQEELSIQYGKDDTWSNQETISEKVDLVFTPETMFTDYPDAVYSKNAVMHITRIGVQTVLDLLSDYPTHMTVADPFDIFGHTWDETTIT